jgi:hypothetical protein
VSEKKLASTREKSGERIDHIEHMYETGLTTGQGTGSSYRTEPIEHVEPQLRLARQFEQER